MVPFQKMVKIPQQNGTISGSKGSKFLNKSSTISKKGSKILNKNGTISEKGQISKILDKNGIISEKGQNSSTKMVPFQKRVKNRQQKWYHFIKGSKIDNKNGTILVRKWSNKNGTISEKCQNSSKKWYHFRKCQNSSKKMVP